MMQKLSMGIVVLIAFVCAGCGVPLEGAPTIGPGGGYVFYDKGSYSDGWRYLEAAPKDAGKTEWGAYNTTVGGTSKGIGSGKHNTELIIAKLAALGESGRAAQLCDSFAHGGKDDWFLPSANELAEMMAVLSAEKYEDSKFTSIPYDDGDAFWSSSEESGGSAYYYGSGRYSEYSIQSLLYSKTDNFRVRPIRQF